MIVVKAVHAPTGEWTEFAAELAEPLLDQLERHCPFPIPYMCSMGACEGCAATVTQGERWIDARAFDVGCSAEPGEGRVLLCVAGPSAPAALNGEVHQVVLQIA